MTSRELAYWLQGYFELTGAGAALSAAQAEMIRQHCCLVQAECPNDLFAAVVHALADDAPALGKIIAAQFSVVTRPAGDAPAPRPKDAADQLMLDMLRDMQCGPAVKFC